MKDTNRAPFARIDNGQVTTPISSESELTEAFAFLERNCQESESSPKREDLGAKLVPEGALMAHPSD